MTGHDPHHPDHPVGDPSLETHLRRSMRRDVSGRCPDLQTIAALIDDRLPSDERDGVEGHLAECGDCMDAWLEARLGIAERDARLPMVPPDVAARARGLVTGASAGRTAGPWRWAVAAAAAIAVSIAGYAVGTTCGPQRSIEEPVLAIAGDWSGGELLGIDPLGDPLLDASWILVGEVSP